MSFITWQAQTAISLGMSMSLPLPPLLAWLSTAILGDSLTALRFLPALVGALAVGLTVRMTQLLGGKGLAQCTAGLATIAAPVWLSMNSFFTYDPFDQFAICSLWFLLVKIIHEKKETLWIPFGVCAGIALMTKMTTLFFGAALALSLLLTPERRHLQKHWIYLGGIVAAIHRLPFIAWQIHANWPILEYYSNYVDGKTYQASPGEFLLMQVITQHPLSLVVWGFGILYPFIDKTAQHLRVFSILVAFLFVTFATLKMKFYLLSSSFFILFAMGAVAWEKQILHTNFEKQRKRFRAACAFLLLWGLSAIFIAPNALPILPIETFVNYLSLTAKYTGAGKVKMERHDATVLPQQFADRFGWAEFTHEVAKVFERIPADQQKDSLILVNNYGKAGAIDHFGPQYKLPKAVSGHLSYFIWGYGIEKPAFVVSVGYPLELLNSMYSRVEESGKIYHKYSMPYENNIPIYLCSQPKYLMSEVWEKFKRMN
jgi:4-amino-4-deoxy-L-arabinose transferase-like glycosyltransferase